jgi:ABC-type polysaccharide/polyol phosphate transport system ATPase subunit
VKPILEIKNVSKSYSIAHEHAAYLTLRDKLTGIFQRNEQTEEFWALNDITFDVQPGESIGIIGRNGAGKSTLLKILSRITPPTKGSIVARGRIASLLEVGTGFHQELTGRENIFMNGSILGMKKTEIKSKFDEIVDFSGVEKFLDTPLKNYSSGMQLRLAFAVAAHLEPEILIVDEVLAVGDSEFQKKCMGKMEDVTGQGRTILFVSHNLASLKAITKRGLCLKAGSITADGPIDEVIEHYSATHATGNMALLDTIHYFQDKIKVRQLTINGHTNNLISFDSDSLTIDLTVEALEDVSFELDVHIKRDETHIASYANFVNHDLIPLGKGIHRFSYRIQIPPMRSGRYLLDLYFTEPFASWYAISVNQIEIDVVNGSHHTFLSTASLKWGSLLLQGTCSHSTVNTA